MIEQVTFKITGISPLLMHSTEGMKAPGGKQGVKIKEIPSPQEEAETACYRLKNGQLCIPTINFRGSIIGKGGGASGRRIGKSTANSRCAAGLMINDKFTECPLYHPKTRKPITDYKIDIRPVVIQRNRIMRARPCISEWACDLIFDIDTDFVTVDQVLELLNISGRVSGVCDFRPSCKGWFGKYKAEIKK